MRRLFIGVLAVLAVLAVYGNAPRSVRSFEFIGAKWNDASLPVPYCVNPVGIPNGRAGSPVMTQDQFVSLVRRSFDRWQQLADSYITFRYTGWCYNDPRNGNDGSNTVGWARAGGSIAGVTLPGASQETPFTHNLAGDLTEVDIFIDDRIILFVDENYYINHLLPVIVLHEIGHFVGLGHSNVGCSVMTPSSTQLEFCSDDTVGVRTLYPGPQRASDLWVDNVSCGYTGVDATFRWSASPEVEGYWLDVTADPGWGGWWPTFIPERSTGEFRMFGIPPGSPQYWRLWNFGAGLGNYTWGLPFVAPLCGTGYPVPGGPADLNVTTSCAPDRSVVADFSWTRSMVADGYFLDLALDPSFGGYVNGWTPGQDSRSLNWSGLLPGAQHFFRLLAYNANGASYSYTQSFSTPDCAGGGAPPPQQGPNSAYLNRAAATVAQYSSELSQYWATPSLGGANDIYILGSICLNFANAMNGIQPVPPEYQPAHNRLVNALMAMREHTLAFGSITTFQQFSTWLVRFQMLANELDGAITNFMTVTGITVPSLGSLR